MKTKKWIPTLAVTLALAAILCLTVFAEKGFSDVASSDYFFTPVSWAVEKSIAQGTSGTTFSPGAVCSRGQIVTFLWRAFGKPQPATATNLFSDVAANDYFNDAVLWASEKKITLGTSEKTFSPNVGCTRGQIVTFLWRSVGEPKPGATENPFADVKESDYFYTAVLWAIQNNITQGTAVDTFSPQKNCTRGETVTFLYRARTQIPAAVTEIEVPSATETVPVAPAVPVIPPSSGTLTPTEPEKPTDPEKPTEPETPAEPESPTEPETPTEPEKPTEPGILWGETDPNAGTWIP